MGQVLAIHDLRRAAASVKDESHPPIPAVVRTEGGYIGGKLVTLRRDIIPGCEDLEVSRITLAQRIDHPCNRGQIIRIGLTIVDELLDRKSTRLNSSHRCI